MSELLAQFHELSKNEAWNSGHPFVGAKKTGVCPQLDIVKTSEALGAIYYIGGCLLVMQHHFILSIIE